MKLPKNFFITYFAKKHSKFITRKASATKPNGVEGKMFTDRNGVSRYIYWDLEARDKKTNELGAWRHATGNWNIKAI